MKKIIIDTNCLLSFVTDRDVNQQEKVSVLFGACKQLKKRVVCHQHVISEFVWVLSSVYAVQAENVRRMVADLISMPGVEYAADVDMRTLLSLWPQRIPDYGDAVLAAYCAKNKGTCIATFDRRFRNALRKAGLPVFRL